MSLIIPVEICEMIIDHLRDEKAALRNCSLVCKTWLPSARFHIFQKLELAPWCIEKVLATICAEGSTIPAQVRHLDIHHEDEMADFYRSTLLRLPPLINIRSISLYSLNWATLDDDAKMRLSSMLRQTTSLVLQSAKFKSLEEAIQAIASAPLLEKLVIMDGAFGTNDISFTSVTAPKIKSLKIDSGEYLGHFLAWLRSSHAVPSVRSLNFSWHFGERVFLSPICEYIAHLGPSLEHLFLRAAFYHPHFNAVLAEKIILNNNDCLRSIHFGPLNLRRRRLGHDSTSWAIKVLSKIVSKSFEKVTLELRCEDAEEVPIDDLMAICEMLTDENNIFQGQSVKLRIEIVGYDWDWDQEDDTPDMIEAALAGLHAQRRLEIELRWR